MNPSSAASSGPTQAKLSFAKVAASAYKPERSREAHPPTKPTGNGAIPPNSHKPAVSAVDCVSSSETMAPSEPSQDRSETNEQPPSSKEQYTAPTTQQMKDDEAERRHPAIVLMKTSLTEDSGTQVSSSDGSAKPASLDGKSVASANTFALDEKESIRPDDSASLRAVEEEDITSPPDAGSGVSSDLGARAFRDQLHEIAVNQRAAPPGRFPPVHSGPHHLFDPNQVHNGVPRPPTHPALNGLATQAGPTWTTGPDDKLLEALASPRDRLFVLKLEQDFIDFIKDSCETEFVLPNCNTFYRMLAHRLADYYLLGHTVDDSMTTMRITRTVHCRIPAPLSGINVPSKHVHTPPVDMPARKIMRRGEDGQSGTNTAANSEGPSKTTSEAGGASGSENNDGESKERTALTREEREARYREARQRIFGNKEPGEGEGNETGMSGDSKDVSRSSSAAGRKKTKKQRNYDDDFEARSRFNAYYPQPYGMPGYGADQAVYYSGYPGPIQTTQFAGMGTPSGYPGYQGMVPQDGPNSYGAWPGQQFGSTSPTTPYSGYPAGYDLSADFQRGMQSFQSAGVPSQITPKMANPSMAAYPDTYSPQSMSMNNGWSPPYSTMPYTNGARPMAGPMPPSNPSQYPYGQLPVPPYNGLPDRNQHPLPGSFNRQQFNPQSQSFVPGSRPAPYQMTPTMVQATNAGLNGHLNYAVPGASPAMPHTQAFSSSSHGPRSSDPSAGLFETATSSRSAATQSHTESGSNAENSSIAKWGTPAHLPPKPPAPAPLQGPKFAMPPSGSPQPKGPTNTQTGPAIARSG
ncbi:hypothetical protein M011DRAFT_522442 [Sporormia fimetaria CBS 119925]|uniref:SUZ domain-containing protein n=1 Tax=Sporormia fimetaria CBS 119925 TaxID=1340428 RepID=A0A6A6UVX1_9PLEO|nr:hypothetical protein M011DRAFT_522442 [Sporormia fimetaria CBS 119925]